MKGNKVEKLDFKFLLVTHPFPQVEGEMIIFQMKKDDQDEEDLIVVRDYSLRKRLLVEEKKSTLKKKKEELEAKLQCLEIDNGEPLSPFEWRNLSHVMREVKGMAWF